MPRHHRVVVVQLQHRLRIPAHAVLPLCLKVAVEIAGAVAEITVAGNLKSMFLNLTPADDLVFRYAVNAPTLRIEGMTVAGA